MSNERRNRILFVLENFPPHIGGVETLFQNLTRALAEKGWEVTVVTTAQPGAPALELMNGVRVMRVRVPPFARRYFFCLLSLPCVLREAKTADIIHTTTYTAALPAWIASRYWKKPSVLTVHEVFARQWHELKDISRAAGLVFFLIEKIIIRLPFTRYVCDSRFTLKKLEEETGLPSGRICAVYPAVDYEFWDPSRHERRDLKKELGLPKDSFLYLYFGRPGVSKGLSYLIDAALEIRDRCHGSHLVLILAKDPPSQYKRLCDKIRALNLEDHVRILDPVPRGSLPGYILGADCVVVPSISEGFGYSAIESVCMGQKVIATSGHAVEEILSGKLVLVPPRRSAALADAVCEIAKKGDVGRSFSFEKRFTLEAHVREMAAVYEALTQSPSGSIPSQVSGQRRPQGMGR